MVMISTAITCDADGCGEPVDVRVEHSLVSRREPLAPRLSDTLEVDLCREHARLFTMTGAGIWGGVLRQPVNWRGR
jgi:hypothetical protein